MSDIYYKKYIIIYFIITLFILSVSAESINSKEKYEILMIDDFDPLVDIEVTVEIKAIRSLEKSEYLISSYKKIDLFSDPDFFIRIFINDHEFESNLWKNKRYVYNPQFSAKLNVPDDEEFVQIKIQLIDKEPNSERLCDISGSISVSDVDLIYSIKTAHWTGDDYLGDPSGYGKLNGCDDGSIYSLERDCEIWFDIYQNDFDNDKIPYFTEFNDYKTDPEVDDTGKDLDNDFVPIEWEWKWGYNPILPDNHKFLDPDDDGLTNYEEYLTCQWDSDPFRKDIYIELDVMEESPDGVVSGLSEESKELLRTAFDRYNKVIHIDDGSMGGGEILPFDSYTSHSELDNYYWNYFLNGNENNWRKGVFRYSLIVYDPGNYGYNFEHGAFVISSYNTNNWVKKWTLNTEKAISIGYASVYMHETGHTLRIFNPGVDNINTMYPYQLGWWLYGPYKSCMNYRYCYRIVDYSSGSRAGYDFNDWEDMDLSRYIK